MNGRENEPGLLSAPHVAVLRRSLGGGRRRCRVSCRCCWLHSALLKYRRAP